MLRVMRGVLLVGILVCLARTPASAKADASLPPRFQKWLDEVALLISPTERKAFLALREDSRRDAFIAAFWKARDPDPTTPDNNFQKTYYARREQAKERYGSVDADAAKVFILDGEPGEIYRMDCGLAFWPLMDTAQFVPILVAITLGLAAQTFMYAPQAALFAELFTVEVRYSGASLGYQTGAIFGGGFAPIIAGALLASTGSSMAIGVYMAVLCTISLVSVFLLAETHKRA